MRVSHYNTEVYTNEKTPERKVQRSSNKAGDYLFFRGVASQVPSAMESLTTVFEMGTGVPSPVTSPANHAMLLSRRTPKNSILAPSAKTLIENRIVIVKLAITTQGCD